MKIRIIGYIVIGTLLLPRAGECQEVGKKPDEQATTIDGPEAKDVLGRITGSIVIDRGKRGIVAQSLPTMKETIVRPWSKDANGDYPTIHVLSGPDGEGRIAYIEDYFFVKKQSDQKHMLKIIKLDGTAETTLFSRPGNAMWATTGEGRGEIGTNLALAPVGGKVALLTALKEKQMRGALLHVGKIEIWDIEKRVPLAVDAKALDNPMSWFPDGKRLAYVKLVPRDQLPQRAPGLEEFGKYGEYKWGEVPTVFVLDIQTGTSTFLHVGWTPIVSLDDKIVLVGGWNDQMDFVWRRVGVVNGQSEPVRWPGDAGGAIAAPTEDIVLYWGLPTTGAPVKYTTSNSKLSGPKFRFRTFRVY
jgi:hypothetical protein